MLKPDEICSSLAVSLKLFGGMHFKVCFGVDIPA
jgi:hypothetical protein